MTGCVRVGIFSRLRLGLVGAAMAAGLIQLSGCASTDDSMSMAPVQPSGLSSGQARNTGTFPNLNIRPQPAASQISADEKAAKLSELKSAQSSQAAGGGSGAVPNDEALLKKLATTHGQKTLSEIEGH